MDMCQYMMVEVLGTLPPLLISSEQTLTKCFREILAAYGGVHLEDIRGMRAPFLAIGVPTFQNLDHDR